MVMSVPATITLVTISALLASCGEMKPHASQETPGPETSSGPERVEMEVENIGNEEVLVEIDRIDSFVMPGLSRMKALIPKSTVLFRLNQTDTIELTVKPGKKLLVNPDRKKIYLKSVAYDSDAGSTGSAFRNFIDTIEVAGYRAIGLYKDLGDAMMIQGFWNFGLYEEFPESITVQSDMPNSGGKNAMGLRTKVYDEQSLLEILESQYRIAVQRGLKDGFSEDEIKELLGLTDEQMRRLKKMK